MSTPVIGVTGSIGSGKTTLSKFLADEGGYHLNADTIARDMMLPGQSGYDLVLDQFGNYITDSKGYIEPAILADLVFTKPDELRKLEAILHPLVFDFIEQTIHLSQEGFYIVDAPLLFEAGIDKLCDWTVCVVSSPDLISQRVEMTETELERRRRLQWPEDKKVRQANEVIDNSGSLEHLQEKAAKLAGKLLSV